jgi:hypothetical protein
MLDDFGLLNDSNHFSRAETVSGADAGPKQPLLLMIEGRDANALADVLIRLLANDFQPSLDAVKDSPEKPRAQFDGKRHPGPPDLLTGAKARGVLIDLCCGDVSLEANDFADEVVGADLNNLGHLGVANLADFDDGSHDASDFANDSLVQVLSMSLRQTRAPGIRGQGPGIT